MKKYSLYIVVCVGCFFFGCSNLEEEILDEINNEDILNEPGSEKALLAAAYSGMDNTFTSFSAVFGLQELTTDEAILPTRITDWDDNGRWREYHQFTWGTSSQNLTETWTLLSKAMASSLQAIYVIEKSNIEKAMQYVAEARGLTAFYAYIMMDLYGQVPYRNPENLDFQSLPKVLSSEEALHYIVSELKSIIPNLPSHSSENIGSARFSKETAYGLLARIYLNKAVYLDRYSNRFTFLETDMEKVVAYTDSIINSQLFSLESEDYFNMFDLSNHNHPEFIWAVDQRNNQKQGSNDFAVFSYARSQHTTPTTRGYNGAATTPEFVATWGGNINDPRFYKEVYPQDGSVTSLPYPEKFFKFNRGFMQGLQYGPIMNAIGDDFKRTPSDSSQIVIAPLKNLRDGLPTFFTLDFEGGIYTTQAAGVRVFKYEFDPKNGNVAGGVDIPIIRLADIYLMRAEAQLRLGNVSEALNDINTIRKARKAQLLETINLETLYNERGYELYWEQLRRIDMIRFGKFEDTYTEKNNTDIYRRVFPIPQTALDAHLELQQNIGY